MAPDIDLGALTRCVVRESWPNEPRDSTPWLAQNFKAREEGRGQNGMSWSRLVPQDLVVAL
jgi:hypothetical protein